VNRPGFAGGSAVDRRLRLDRQRFPVVGFGHLELTEIDRRERQTVRREGSGIVSRIAADSATTPGALRIASTRIPHRYVNIW
jgi:hypothetical protein